ncbi:MAG: hypothetical protein ACLFVU_08855 [Phycisphaerae bacterium]
MSLKKLMIAAAIPVVLLTADGFAGSSFALRLSIRSGFGHFGHRGHPGLSVIGRYRSPAFLRYGRGIAPFAFGHHGFHRYARAVHQRNVADRYYPRPMYYPAGGRLFYQPGHGGGRAVYGSGYNGGGRSVYHTPRFRRTNYYKDLPAPKLRYYGGYTPPVRVPRRR